MFARLRGSFVACLVDCARRLAFVVRDPLGSYPLFYSRSGSVVLFAASPLTLVRQPGVSGDLNIAALADHLCHRWPEPGETFFSAVHRVPPGSLARISHGKTEVRGYWRPLPPDREVAFLPDAASRFDATLDLAVQRGMSGEPAGIFLSGGLDSISVAGVAADHARRHGREPPLALSLAFPDPACDERIVQGHVARELGLRHHIVDIHDAVGSPPLLEQALDLSAALGAPILNPYRPAYDALARIARQQGVQTILTGQGGDEWLTVTPYYAADLIRRGAFLELARFVSCLHRSNRLDRLALLRKVVLGCGLRPNAAMWATRLMPRWHHASRLRRVLRGDPPWLTPDPQLRAVQRSRAAQRLSPADPPRGFYFREIETGLDHVLTSWEAEEHYASSCETGVRLVHPYWDPDLVELLIQTPPRALNEGGRSKGLVRQSLHRRFPGLGLGQQQKVLALTFFHGQLRREATSLVKKAGEFPGLSELGLVDGKDLAAKLRNSLTTSNLKDKHVWLPISLEMWVRARRDA
jgi:asparagine synthetase B (glutamine-hydrolysing)